MSWDVIGNLVSAGMNMFNSAENRAQQSNFNDQSLRIAQQNQEMQREFAQHGISWKIDDAASRGIHPLAALGAQTASFSPISLGGSAATSDLGTAGQDVARAFAAAAPAETRTAREAQEIALEKGRLENEVLRSQLASSKIRIMRQVGPPMAAAVENQVVDGQGDSRIPLPRSGPVRSADGLALKEDEMKQKEGDAPAQAYSRPFGWKMDHNPWASDGQSFEDRYGDSEIGSTLKLMYNLGADALYTARNRYRGAGYRNPFRNPN